MCVVTHKGKWIILFSTVAILIIIAVTIPVTIILTKKEDVAKTSVTILSTMTTTTEKDIVNTSTTTPEQDSISTRNLTHIIQCRHGDPGHRSTRYWYQTEEGSICDGWTMDGIIFRAYGIQEPNTEPVYEFHFEGLFGWHNTLQMELTLPVTPVGQWVFDKVKFYAYKTSMGSEKLQPVHRYWHEANPLETDISGGRTFMLTIGMQDEVQAGWVYDKIVFYALPPEQ